MTQACLKSMVRAMLLACACMMGWPLPAQALDDWPDPAPRRVEEGEGPFKRLLLVNAHVVDGTGAQATAATSIVVEYGRITVIGEVQPQEADRVIDVRGGYVLPGFVDTHVRVLDELTPEIPPDYTLKLLLAHGITTIASMQPQRFVDWALRLQRAAEANAVVSPRVQVWVDIEGDGEQAIRANIRDMHARGVAGLGEGSIPGSPEVVLAGLREAQAAGMNSSWHMSQRACPQLNALQAARAGLRGLAHWYCLPEVLLEGRHPEGYPADLAFPDVRARFIAAGSLWKQVPEPGSAVWNRTLDDFLALDFTFEPTFSVYEANRDYMRASSAAWHAQYLHPRLARTFIPDPDGLFSHFYDWSSATEAEWHGNFQVWMRFVRDYAQRGGRIVAGADAGYMWSLPGFGFVRNLEMLQEAGLTSPEVIRAATLSGAEHLRIAGQVGSIAPGKLADLVVLDQNPLQNLKALYGTGYPGLRADGAVAELGGVRYTIKGGVVYDAKALLRDVAELVRAARITERETRAP